MAQVLPLRPHTFRLDNIIIDTYAAEMGAIGLAVYAVLQRYADRPTGQCWPSVATIARLLDLSKKCVKKYLHQLTQLGLIAIAPRYAADGDPTSNLYTIHDPTQTEAVRRRQRQQGGAPQSGGRVADALPPQVNGNVVPHGGAPGTPEQDPLEQFLTTVTTPNTPDHPCDNLTHEHWSPLPGLRICHDCFRAWPVPLTASTAALNLERR